ncbi:MAG: hypothetical protein MO852_08005 [Candidatus Devosia euplotis]|nr:hypothetical protein [Candidatus Devosia euplotis]
MAEAKAFNHELCTVRVLDPACGADNFLYVSLELMKSSKAKSSPPSMGWAKINHA